MRCLNYSLIKYTYTLKCAWPFTAFVWVVFKCVFVVLPCDTESECIVLAVTFSSSFSYFWLLFLVTPLPPLLSLHFHPSTGEWGTAESLERLRLSLAHFMLCSAGHQHLKSQSQLGQGDTANILHIFLISWMVISFNRHGIKCST